MFSGIDAFVEELKINEQEYEYLHVDLVGLKKNSSRL